MLKPKYDYKILTENVPDAFAYHQIVVDGAGTPVDYIFLEANSSFEAMTGLTREEVIVKKVTQLRFSYRTLNRRVCSCCP